MERDFQPRFVAYAAEQGRLPEAQLAHDAEQWPGGKMCGFILWIPEAWARWAAETGERPEWAGAWSDRQHRKFDAWCAARSKP